jgi:hypothetical protein
MGIAQWSLTADSNFLVFVDETNVILEDGSLTFRHNGTGPDAAILIPDDSTLITGLPRGRFQTVFRIQDMTEDNGLFQRACLCFMISNTIDMLSSSSMYGLSLINQDTGTTRFELGKSTGSGVLGLANQLGSWDIVDIPVGLDLAVQVDWIYDPYQFAGVQITGRYGVGTSFGSMIEIFKLIDQTGFLYTSEAEGLAVSASTGYTKFSFLFDNTSLYGMVLAPS